MAIEGYTLQQAFEDFRTEMRNAVIRIEGKVDATDEKVNRLITSDAVQTVKLGLLMTVLSAVGMSIGAAFGKLVLGGG